MANRRFEMYEYRQVLVRMRTGASNREIARAGLMGRKKVQEVRAVAEGQGWLDPGRPLAEDGELERWLRAPAGRSSTTSLVETFREEVTGWWKQGIQGTTIHAALVRKHGFAGSYSSVRRFLQSLDPGPRDPTVILEFAPGEVAQVDFGQGPRVLDRELGEEISTWVFVMTLAWSRHQYAEIVRDQKVETWLACHRRAFEFFGGVPHRLMVDNAKCAITRACIRDPQVQRAYAELAEGYGFRIDPCPPRDPRKKGRVESGVKYIKRGFLPLRDLRDRVDANRQLEAWVLGEAGNRLHGTTHERPLSRFTETERYLLLPLPAVAPEPATWHQVTVHRHGHVQLEKCLYSVPFEWIGQRLWLRATATMVQAYADSALVATHPRLFRPGARSTVEDHLPPEARAYRLQDADWCRQQAADVGPACRALIEALFADRVLDNLRAAQGVIGLARRFGRCRLEAACQRALAFDHPRYRTVKTILEKGLDQVAASESAFDRLAETYTGGGRFSRDTRTLLIH